METNETLSKMNHAEGGAILRESGIEILKIISILLIILSHVVQSLHDLYEYVPYRDFVLPLGQATTDLSTLILTIFRYSGELGNAIFFLCSAWFFLDRETSSKKKIFYLIADVWTMSVCILIPVFILRKGDIGIKLIIKSFFPTIFGNNWYITCYILFSLLYPFLNRLIRSMDQRELLHVALFLGVCYLGIDLLISAFFPSVIIAWVAMYFVMAYCKFYLKNITESKKYNLLILSAGVIGNLALILITNFLGLKLSFFQDKTLRWDVPYNPCFFLTAFALLNLFRRIHFRSKIINGVSKLLLLIYLFHDNMLVRCFYRPWFWQQIYLNFGYSHIIGWVFLMVFSFFAVSLVVCLIYSKTVQALTHKICDKVYFIPQKFLAFVETKIFKVTKSDLDSSEVVN